ncbi:trimethyllysine dioxygenase [Coniochaeta sp. 2T2.1]|nr:trimethyllysine dioxygenase [Coniochaeta sp. 2T2.1]
MRGVLGFRSGLARARPRLSTISPTYIRPSLIVQRQQTTESAATFDSQGSTGIHEGTRPKDDLKRIRLDSNTPEQGTFDANLPQNGVLFELLGNAGSPKTKRTLLPSLWLRDNCRCSECVNQDTMQRNFDTFKIPVDIHPKSYKKTDTELSITWSDDHVSTYSLDFIKYYLRHSYRKLPHTQVKREFFTSELANNPPSVPYEAVMHPDDKGVAELTSLIMKHGFAFVDNTPHSDPLKTKQLLERIAFIRETHYGGFYDFTPDLSMADTAYTNLALPAHTDTTYFSDPAGLQSFHLLSHTPAPTSNDATQPDTTHNTGGEAITPPPSSPQGGKSLLVDGFRAAAVLRRESPLSYKILSSVRLPWHASGNAGITISPDRRYPVLELGPERDSVKVCRVRWNNDDRGVVPLLEKEGGFTPAQWYEAARKWDEILRRKESELWIQLVPGRVLIFDNWRVLHGREAFEGVRRICGAYINRDDFISRWMNTNLGKDDLLKVVG